MVEIVNDIFISYRNDGTSEQFASRLYQDLSAEGYSVYYNPQVKRQQDYREKITQGVLRCEDFILVLSDECLKTLKENRDIDWVRHEILLAYENHKHIIPVLINGAEMPLESEFPEQIRFIHYIDAIVFPRNIYSKSPFAQLEDDLKSFKNKDCAYKYVFAGNDELDICQQFKDTLTKAKAGDVHSMYVLASMYYWGIGGESQDKTVVNYEQATYWLERVINESDDSSEVSGAQALLGKLYYFGCVPGKAQSYEMSFDLQEKAAGGNSRAKAELLYLLRTGCGCDYDYNRIVQYYEEVKGELNDGEVMGVARYFASVGYYKKAAELFESVRNMSPELELELGMLYKKGVIEDPPKPDLFRAAYHLRNAADGKNVTAMYELGRLHFNPTGDQHMKDFEKAKEFFLKGAKAGHAQCQYILGFMYKYGHVEKDYLEAIKWLEKSVAQGNTNAAVELVTIYWDPDYCNFQRAFECAKMSAMVSIPEGELFYGVSLLLGRGCKSDYHNARRWLEKAKEHGIDYASVLANM